MQIRLRHFDTVKFALQHGAYHKIKPLLRGLE